jgi:3-oxoacyl-[acyl-carrier protein] reductase
MQFTGKTVLITGAAGGIGSAVARAFAAAGANVVAADKGNTDATVNAARSSGAQILGVSLDVTNLASIKAMVQQAESHFGGIDILVTAAGVTGFGSAVSLATNEWDRIIDINLKGVFMTCQAVIGPMRRHGGGGRIVNIGSILAKNGGNARPWIVPEEQSRSGNIAYGVSKAGVHAMTLYLARELAASAITVNAVAPGPIASAMTATFPEALKQVIPLNRLGTADEVAAAVLFLAGPSAAFITGEILDVNGGMWAD